MNDNKYKLNKRLAEIQQNLNAPKNQRNSFGDFNYRSCEDILMAAKPLMGDLTIRVTDEFVLIGERYCIKATAIITDGIDSIETTAFAQIPNPTEKKKMDVSQITGSASSYARKYALNGLLMIDDNRDSDTMSGYDTPEKKKEFSNSIKKTGGINISHTIKMMGFAKTEEELRKIFSDSWKEASPDQKKVLKSAYDSRKKDILGFVIGETPESFQRVLDDSQAGATKADRLVQQVRRSHS